MNYKYLITINAEQCRGCRICEMVCSFSHETEFNPTKSRIRSIRTEVEENVCLVPVVCQQCEDPVCMDVCPVGAIYEDSASGAKLVNQEKCIGCRRCVYVCPFGGISVDPDTKTGVKCDLCEGDPQCVEFCPFDALEYVRSDKIDIQRKRKGIQAVLEFQQEVVR